ncbi:hypothetical protein GCM10011309_18480 [Litorimonas cladophorae]|uniref:DUF3604 domain-containing protein n=1 Tax=Litorimonas cladophorae TaxID=1220491 RepID=A0A918KMT8_9PROT|nr:DUF3604 domain-containing protein [Litorimonas cladophorae]GGX68914.1 hypothetical protein GCM10011309_18480 [Litorimonas cladophorae]
MHKNLWAYSALVMVVAACQPAETAIETALETPALAEKSDVRTPGYSASRNVYFGDLHIHTKNSFDAYIFNVRSTPADVYRFALGETLVHPAGFKMALQGPPLDFVAATDHGAYMGILPAMDNPDSPLSDLELSRKMFDAKDQDAIIRNFQSIGSSVRKGEPIPEIYDRDLIDRTWQDAVATADEYYRPGELTTFAAYEYTAVTSRSDSGDTFGGGNLHRNVVFESAAPQRLFSVLDSNNPEDLWDWMDDERSAGRDVLAIPHNSNVSDGQMFDLVKFEGGKIDADYTSQRLRNEPIIEMSQVKGTSETHPALSPNDEFADFEIYELLLASTSVSKINGSYLREALARGLALEEATGTNPYEFGLIGSSDSHVAGGAYDENDYWSKVGIVDGSAAERGSVPPGGAKTWEGIDRDPNAENWFSKWGAAGYAAVWAEENTRESIFDGMRRRETYATSGPRIRLRFFGGDVAADMLDAADMVEQGYSAGVPMGGKLSVDGAPSFMAWAARDPRGAPLERLQIIKSWSTAEGPQEAIYDMACSDGATPDSQTNRCPDNGASVELTTCQPSTGQGDPELKAVWTDPDYEAGINAAYYVRVLENPTCRWSTYDALRAGVERNPDLPATLRERAWSSPIWTSHSN